MTESEKQHQSEGFDIVVVLERLEDSLDECREVDFGETCAELEGQYILLNRGPGEDLP